MNENKDAVAILREIIATQKVIHSSHGDLINKRELLGAIEAAERAATVPQEQLQPAGDAKPVVRLHEYTSDRPYSEGKKYFEMTVLDRSQCVDGMELFATPAPLVAPVPDDETETRSYAIARKLRARGLPPVPDAQGDASELPPLPEPGQYSVLHAQSQKIEMFYADQMRAYGQHCIDNERVHAAYAETDRAARQSAPTGGFSRQTSAGSIGDDAEFARLMRQFHNEPFGHHIGAYLAVIAYITRWADARPASPAVGMDVVIEEAAQVLESAAAYNHSKGRTVLAHVQQDRAHRLRQIVTK